jgi:methylglutaconyl-CoA hydratase
MPDTASPDDPTLHVEARDGVLTITLADEKNRNALGGALLAGVHRALTQAQEDPSIRVVVLTNTGTTFCAGANLRERLDGDQPDPDAIDFVDVLRAIRDSSKPVVARIAGHAVGGGNGLAAVCDIAVAADDVKFGFTEVRLGVAPAIISVVCLPKMRHGDALEAFLRGHRFPAARAAELGLIQRAVAREDLDAEIEAIVADLRRGGPGALAFAKQLVYRVPGMEIEEAFAWTSKTSSELFAGPEATEGMSAFLGKRAPSWAKDD